jgi:hypothetical protein
VDAEERTRSRTEHGGDLLICHCFVGSERGEHVGEFVAVVLPGLLGQQAALGVHAGEVGGYCEDFLAGAEFVEGVEQVRPDFCWRHLSCRASGGEKEAHIILILLLVGRWFFGFEFDKKKFWGLGCEFWLFYGCF